MIGLFEDKDSRLALAANLPDEARNRRSGEGLFRRVLREFVFAERLNTNLWESEGGTRDLTRAPSQEGARDLTRALSWYLVQDVYDAPGRWDQEPDGLDSVATVQGRQLKDHERVIGNDTRWGAFTRWAPYLGFAWLHEVKGKRMLVPDPSAAIRDTLSQVFDQEAVLILPAFVERLASRLPVLDGGTYRIEVEKRINRSQLRIYDEDSVSTSLAHALLSLQDEGKIRLENRADAGRKIRFPNQRPDESVFSHVAVVGPPK